MVTKKQIIGMAMGAFTLASAAIVPTMSFAQDNTADNQADTELSSVPIPQPRPDFRTDQDTDGENAPAPETRQEYSMSDATFNVLESFGVDANNLEFIPMTQIRFEDVCLDQNNNGIADREVASTTTNLVPPTRDQDEMTMEIERTYGEIAKVDDNLAGMIVYADLNNVDTTTEFSGANVESIVDYAQSKPFDSIAIIYDQAQVTENEHPMAYIVSTINKESSIAFIEGYDPFATPAQKFCSSLQMPAPGQTG
jgi:hypothetical protein